MRHFPTSIAGPKFPPNPKHWPPERNGHSLRHEFGREHHVQLDPFEIAQLIPGVKLIDSAGFERIVGSRCANELFGPSRRKWSGFVVPIEGLDLVVINNTHAITRQVATLTEELFHIRLGHKPSRIFLCPQTGLLRREYSPEVEHEAYWSAAAALVPYRALSEMFKSGATIESIAEHFCVSISLVQFRLNVTRLVRRAARSRSE
jgi:IrrE N-terminal-like domain